MFVQHIAMVVAGAILQLFERGVDAFSHSVWGAEIHRSAFHFQDFTRRNGIFVYGQVEVGIDGNDMVKNRGSWIANAPQVEKAMIGQVDHRRFVSSGLICYV